MANRMQLRNMLVRVVAETLGITEQEVNDQKMVLGQVPASFKLSYPCIKYSLDKVRTYQANNTPFFFTRYYSVMVIDRDPESPLFEAIKCLPRCTVDRFFIADNLYHFNFTIQY